MNTLETLVWSVHVILAVIIVVLVLLQHGKGADMGAAFGSGSSGSLFGASGSASFLSRSTGIAAALFFATSMALTYLSANRVEDAGVMGGSVMENIDQPVSSPAQVETKPAAGGAAIQAEVPAVNTPSPSKAEQIPK